LNNDGAEIRNSSVRQVTDAAQDKEKVELVVHKGLNDLRGLEMFVLNTSLVLSQSLHCNPPLAGRKTRSIYRGIGEEYEHDDTPCRAKGAASGC
jgi:hypothetical protein